VGLYRIEDCALQQKDLQVVKSAIETPKFNEVHELNTTLHGVSTSTAKKIANELLKQHKASYKKGRNDLSIPLT